MRTEKIKKLEAEHTHSYGAKWAFDANKHWHECDCGDKAEEAAHIENSGTITKKPTVDRTGIRTYNCAVCGVLIRTEEIAKLEAEHTHSYSDSWKSDNNKHWRECDCGDKADEGAHNETEEIIKQPTVNEKGAVRYRCSVCGNERLGYIDKLPPEEFDVDYTGGSAVVTAAKSGTYTVIFAAYGAGGSLTDVEICTVSFDAAGEKTVSPVRFSGNGANKVKIMLWDGIDNVIPLCESVTK